MESLSPQVVSAAKLPILNPNEFDLWKMRIEQYFLMTNYSLWEVILNCDSPAPTRVIKGVIQPVAPTTVEQRLAKKNELKACGTLLMALPDKHQLKFNIHKDAKTLMEAIEKSTNEPVSAAAGSFDVSAKIPVSALPNVDTLSNVFIYSFFSSQSTSPKLDNLDLKQINADDLEETDLKWQMAMLSVRARRFLQRTGRNLGANGPTSMGFDMSKVECYNCHKKGQFARECRYQSGDGYHDVPLPYTGTFMPPKPDLVFYNAPNVNETVHTAFNVELSPTKPDNDLSHTHRTLAPIIEDWVSDSEDDSKTKITQDAFTANPKTALPKPKSHGNSKNRKACFVCKSLTYLIKDCDYHAKKMAQTPARNHAPRGHHQQYATMTLLNPQRHVAPPAVLTKSKLVPIIAVRPVNAVVPKPHVTRPKQAKNDVTKPNLPPRRHINRSPSPKASNFPPTITTAKAPMVNVVQGNWGNPRHALKVKGVIDSGCSRHMTGNMSYLSDFEELNGGYVTFGGNPKGGKISGKDSLDKFDGKVDEGFLVGYSLSSKETLHINFLENKPNVAGSGPTWLFDIDTLTKTMNYQPITAGNQSNPSACFQEQFDAEKTGDESVQQYEPEFEGRKPQFEVYVSSSSSAQTTKHDDKTKREAKGKSLVESLTGYRNLSADTNTFSVCGPSNAAVSPTHGKSSHMDSSQYLNDLNMPELEDITYSDDEEDVGAEADLNIKFKGGLLGYIMY
uniref:CCHC-type domain-containing protein n=1 Tax=Tanacetum cinerariifolium TaxID=118510 RepID=A0A6L2MYZ9_TANCI|nr:hypothetical protein [Tanacetum cinerariifolium]